MIYSWRRPRCQQGTHACVSVPFAPRSAYRRHPAFNETIENSVASQGGNVVNLQLIHERLTMFPHGL